jgi:hypothetical protein
MVEKSYAKEALLLSVSLVLRKISAFVFLFREIALP